MEQAPVKEICGLDETRTIDIVFIGFKDERLEAIKGLDEDVLRTCEYFTTILDGDKNAKEIDIHIGHPGNIEQFKALYDLMILLRTYPYFDENMNPNKIVNVGLASPFHAFIESGIPNNPKEEAIKFALVMNKLIRNRDEKESWEEYERKERGKQFKAKDFRNKNYTPIDMSSEERVEIEKEVDWFSSSLILAVFLSAERLAFLIGRYFRRLYAYEDCVRYHDIMLTKYNINMETIK
jgi:hypothetical protein